MAKYLALVLIAGAVAYLASTSFERISVWWNHRIEKYASWVAYEFESMFQEMPVERASRLITMVMLGAFATGVLFASGFWPRIVLGIVLASAASLIPWGVVAFVRRRRLEMIDDQLVDALGMMANGLKAGLSLQQAIELVVNEMPRPISDEFGRVLKDIRLGRLLDDALRRLAERVPLEDVRLAVDSILILRETGGNLSETFQVIAYTVVERKKVQGKVKTMTAQGMTQGVVICLMPLALMLLFSFIDPDYVRLFFTTPLGWIMVILVVILDALGVWMMLTLVKVEV